MEQVAGKVFAPAVKWVASNRVTQMGQMDADLVGASCTRHAGHEGPSFA